MICSGYALGEIEGMSKVLVVISNLDETEEYRKSFSKYSLLWEWPVVSANVWNVKRTMKNISKLIENPNLRKKLWRKRKEYIEKYHSCKTFVFLPKNILEELGTWKLI